METAVIAWILIAHINTGVGNYTDAFKGAFVSEKACQAVITKWTESYPRRSTLRCIPTALNGGAKP